MTTKNLGRRAGPVLEAIAGPLTFSGMIESIRLGEEWTLVEMAEKLDVTRQYLCDVEKGRRNVSPERAAEWGRILGYGEKQFLELALQAIVDAAHLGYRVRVG